MLASLSDKLSTSSGLHPDLHPHNLQILADRKHFLPNSCSKKSKGLTLIHPSWVTGPSLNQSRGRECYGWPILDHTFANRSEGNPTLPWCCTLTKVILEVVHQRKTVEKERDAREAKTSDFYELGFNVGW